MGSKANEEKSKEITPLVSAETDQNLKASDSSSNSMVDCQLNSSDGVNNLKENNMNLTESEKLKSSELCGFGSRSDSTPEDPKKPSSLCGFGSGSDTTPEDPKKASNLCGFGGGSDATPEDPKKASSLCGFGGGSDDTAGDPKKASSQCGFGSGSDDGTTEDPKKASSLWGFGSDSKSSSELFGKSSTPKADASELNSNVIGESLSSSNLKELNGADNLCSKALEGDETTETCLADKKTMHVVCFQRIKIRV